MARIVFTATLSGDAAEQLCRMYDVDALADGIAYMLETEINDENIRTYHYDRFRRNKAHVIITGVEK